MTPREKAKEIRDLIRNQPPEVIECLADWLTLDDEGHHAKGDIDECLEDYFDCEGYADAHNTTKATIYCSMALPDIKIKIDAKATPEDGEGTGEYSWEFMK